MPPAFVINGLPEGYDTYKWKIEKGVQNVYNVLQTGVKDHDRNLKSTQTRHRSKPYIYLRTWLFCVDPEELFGDLNVSLPNNQKSRNFISQLAFVFWIDVKTLQPRARDNPTMVQPSFHDFDAVMCPLIGSLSKEGTQTDVAFTQTTSIEMLTSAHRELFFSKTAAHSSLNTPKNKRLKELKSKLQRSEERGRSLERMVGYLKQQNTALEGELSEARTLHLEIQAKFNNSQNSTFYFMERVNKLESLLEEETKKSEDLQSKLEASEAKLNQETMSMGQELKMIGQQLFKAQRRIMAFDQRAIFQDDLRTTPGYTSPVRRCKNYSSSSNYSRVIELVKRLNAAIHEFAKDFVSKQNYECSLFPAPVTDRAEALLGQPLLAIFEGRGILLRKKAILESVLRAFFVTWCIGIIAGWYPKRQNFLDLMMKSSKPQGGETKIITKVAGADYPAWTADIQQDLSAVLSIGGIFPNLQRDRLVPILKRAYVIRTTLAEKDMYENIDVFSAPLQAPLDPSCMNAVFEAHHSSAVETNSGPWQAGYVIGNVGLGLEVNETQTLNGKSTTTKRVILNPEVVVSARIDFAYYNWTYSIIPLLNARAPQSLPEIIDLTI